MADLTGKIFGRLTAVRLGEVRRHGKWWLCRCECGNEKEVPAGNLLRGCTRSCGCLKAITNRRLKTKHGLRNTPEYHAFTAARARCENPKHHAYERYGGRGIRFAFNSFEDFYREVGPRPTADHTLDRIDNNGHYETGNVRWATMLEQARNRRLPRVSRTGRILRPEIAA